MARVVIEARGVGKTFMVPDRRVDSLKEKFTHPFARVEHRRLEALQDVSFDVHEGEFFGIVGRNGSGKSTLLKILASIYRADRGRVRTAGTMAPFIELGVGFNPEQTAWDNVLLNGVLMGLSRREAQGRYEAVLDFAELGDFADVKLKNYSSGMMVRLAFAIMVQADADIMLIDEVLAVGDAAFASKCTEVFEARRRAGRTVVIVTHDMSTVESLCHRGLVLHQGEQVFAGDPNEAAQRYYGLNFTDGARPDHNVDVVSADAPERVRPGAPIAFTIEMDARLDFAEGRLGLILHAANHVTVATFVKPLGTVPVGGRVRVAGELENRLLPGRYSLDAFIHRVGADGDVSVQGLRLHEFEVEGEANGAGVLDLAGDITVSAG